MARYFSLRRQRKVPKRNAGPTACPLARVPCASRYFERSPDSQHLPRLRLANPARQGGSLTLKIPALLGYANGVGDATPGLARNAGHRRQPMSAPGALLFGYFLLGKQEKVPRPKDETIHKKQQSSSGPGTGHPPWLSTQHHPSQPAQRPHHCYAPQGRLPRHASAPAIP